MPAGTASGRGTVRVRIQRLDKGQQDGHDSGHAHELGQDDGDHTQDQDEHDAFFALCFADELAHPADDAGLAQAPAMTIMVATRITVVLEKPENALLASRAPAKARMTRRSYR